MLIRTTSQCSAGLRPVIVPVPSTWPCTRCPPRRPSSRSDRSRFTTAPGPSSPRPDLLRVSPITSAVNAPPDMAVTVRQTPLTAIESPVAVPAVTRGPRTVSLAASPSLSSATTSPSSSTIPVNTASSSAAASSHAGSGDAKMRRHGGEAAAGRAVRVLPPIRPFTVGPGIPPDQPADGIGRVADYHRRLGVTPTPEHALLEPVCHGCYSAAQPGRLAGRLTPAAWLLRQHRAPAAPPTRAAPRPRLSGG